MRKNTFSAAYKDFEISISRAVSLQRLENRLFKDPPKDEDRLTVETLRSSAVILLVSSLEKYLREALEEFVEFLALKVINSHHATLPEGLQKNNDVNYMEWIIRDSKWPYARRHVEIRRISSIISDSRFIPESFSRTKSNPGSDTIKNLLKDFGIKDPFKLIDARLANFFSKNPEHSDSSSVLTTIITRRNQIAHGVAAIPISRSDLRFWITFSQNFVKAIDKCLNTHVFGIIRSA